MSMRWPTEEQMQAHVAEAKRWLAENVGDERTQRELIARVMHDLSAAVSVLSDPHAGHKISEQHTLTSQRVERYCHDCGHSIHPRWHNA